MYNTVKDFFKEYIESDYEFTTGELVSELEKTFVELETRKKLAPFLEKIKVIEYKDNPYTEEQVRELFKEFDEIVTSLVRNYGKKKRKGFFARLFGKKEETPPVKEEHLPEKQTETKETTPVEEQPETQEEKTGETEEKPIEETPPEKTEEEQKEEKAENESLDEDLDILTKATKEIEEPDKLKENETDPDAWVSEAEQKKSEDKEDLTKEAEEDKPLETEDLTKEAAEEKKEEPKKKKKQKKRKTKKKKKDIAEMISEAKEEEDHDKLVDLYHDILEIYEKESGEEQSKHYEDINYLYKKITEEK